MSLPVHITLNIMLMLSPKAIFVSTNTYKVTYEVVRWYFRQHHCSMKQPMHIPPGMEIISKLWRCFQFEELIG